MQDRDKSTARLIMKKSSNSLKISVSMLVIAILVISVMSIIYMKQYYQMDKDFISNVAVHTIKLEQIEDSQVQSQRAVIRDDVTVIEQIMGAYDEGISYEIMPCERNATGIYINDGEVSVKLIAVDKEKSFLLGEDISIQDNILYTYKANEDMGANVTLQCDKVDLENFTSYGTFETNMNIEYLVSERSPLALMGSSDVDDAIEFFVTDDTFNDIMARMMNNVSDIYNCDGSIINTEGIYLYIEDVTKVNKISKYLEQHGIYNTCTFDAFEDMGDSVGSTKVIFAVVEILILLMGVIQMYLAFNAFYKVQQKDMGILRYHGYSRERVYSMYAYNVNKIFYIMAIAVGVITIVIGSIVLGSKHILTSLGIAVIVAGLVLLIALLVRLGIIKKYVGKDMLTLIKASKEFQ